MRRSIQFFSLASGVAAINILGPKANGEDTQLDSADSFMSVSVHGGLEEFRDWLGKFIMGVKQTDFKEMYPVVHNLKTDQTDVHKQTEDSRLKGKKFNERAKDRFREHDPEACKSMAEMRHWLWTKADVDAIYNYNDSATPVEYQNAADEFWQNQQVLNQVWRSEACVGLTLALVDQSCRAVEGAKPGFEAVCPAQASGGCC